MNSNSTSGERAAVYVRVSTDRQEDSPERQMSQTGPYCEKKGFRLVGQPYVDLAAKGWTDARPSFQRLLADAAARRFDVIVVDQGSRLSRQDHLEFAALVAHPLRTAQVRVESVQRGRALDWNDIGEFIVQSVEQHGAHKESANTSWRVLSEWIMKSQRAEVYLGRRPYAYRVVTEGTHKTYAPGPEAEVRVLQYVFESYAGGMSLSEICAELVRRGVPASRGGLTWRASTLARWLRDVVYLGTYRFNCTHYGQFYRRTAAGIVPTTKKRGVQRNKPEDWVTVPNNHPPLVSEELFAAVQGLLTRNRKATTPGRHRRDFLLAGLLVCGSCGSRMTGHRRKRAGSDHVYGIEYRCASSYDAGKCSLNLVREEAVRDSLDEQLTLMLSPEALARLQELARASLKELTGPDRLDPLRAERAKLEKQVERARRTLSLLEADDEVRAVSEDIRNWKGRCADLDLLLNETRDGSLAGLTDSAVEEIRAVMWDFRAALASGDVAQVRAVYRKFIDRVELNIESTPTGKNRHSYALVGGEVYFAASSPVGLLVEGGLLDLSRGGATTGQVRAWTCNLA